jgi:hypothetical protein
MESTASTMLGLSDELKTTKDRMLPLREQLINTMMETNLDTITCGDKSIQLVKTAARKTLSMRKVLVLAQQTLGEEAAAKLRTKCAEMQGEPVVKHSIRITDA